MAVQLISTETPLIQFESELLPHAALWYNSYIFKSGEEVSEMNLNEATQQNVEYMIDYIKTKLRMATGAAMQASSFTVEKYEDIKDIYDMVASKDRFSISEVEALVSELGKLRG